MYTVYIYIYYIEVIDVRDRKIPVIRPILNNAYLSIYLGMEGCCKNKLLQFHINELMFISKQWHEVLRVHPHCSCNLL